MTHKCVAYFQLQQGAQQREFHYILFINQEILTGICFTFFYNVGLHCNSKKYLIDNDYLRNIAVYFYSFYFWEIKSTMDGKGALKSQRFIHNKNLSQQRLIIPRCRFGIRLGGMLITRQKNVSCKSALHVDAILNFHANCITNVNEDCSIIICIL